MRDQEKAILPPFNQRYAEDDNVYLVCIALITLASGGIGSIMVWASYKYDCDADILHFLFVAGITAAIIALVKLISLALTMGPCRREAVATFSFYLVDLRIYTGVLVELAILAWGTVAVLANYQMWKEDNDFCESFPYLLAFVVTVLNWILMPVLFCFICWSTVAAVCRAVKVKRGTLLLSTNGGL